MKDLVSDVALRRDGATGINSTDDLIKVHFTTNLVLQPAVRPAGATGPRGLSHLILSQVLSGLLLLAQIMITHCHYLCNTYLITFHSTSKCLFNLYKFIQIEKYGNTLQYGGTNMH